MFCFSVTHELTLRLSLRLDRSCTSTIWEPSSHGGAIFLRTAPSNVHWCFPSRHHTTHHPHQSLATHASFPHPRSHPLPLYPPTHASTLPTLKPFLNLTWMPMFCTSTILRASKPWWRRLSANSPLQQSAVDKSTSRMKNRSTPCMKVLVRRNCSAPR